MTTEQASFTDLPEILALQKYAFYNVAIIHNNFKIRPLHTPLEELETNFTKYTYLKVIENSRIVAAGRAYRIEDVCKLENIIVSPDRQRCGFGKTIVSSLEQHFSGCSCYELFTGKDTPGNKEFYESLGYVVKDEIPATASEPVLIVMRKTQLY